MTCTDTYVSPHMAQYSQTDVAIIDPVFKKKRESGARKDMGEMNTEKNIKNIKNIKKYKKI